MRLTTATSVLLLTLSTSAFAATGVLGDWMTPTQSVVRIYPCGSNLCAKVVKVSPTAPETTDLKNPDAGLHNRPLCGLDVGTGFQQIDADHLDGGHLYDPESGRTYKGTITSEGDNLKLHGYVGISMFGRTEIWHRVPPVTACK